MKDPWDGKRFCPAVVLKKDGFFFINITNNWTETTVVMNVLEPNLRFVFKTFVNPSFWLLVEEKPLTTLS